MIDTLILALATFFAIIGPIDVAVVFAALAARHGMAERRAMAVRGVLVAGGILLTFALLGDIILSALGISLAALRAAGGVLLLLIGIEMISGRMSRGNSTTPEQDPEIRARDDLAIFPLATPLLAGPGAIGASILLMGNAEGQPLHQAAVILALLIILVITLGALLLATSMQRWLGETGAQVVTRVLGLLLCALGMQFLFEGIRQSGIFG